jgi:hypothetical protein
MELNLLTKHDLRDFKTELIEEVRKIVQQTTEKKEWLKSSEVRALLGCSASTLQNLRINGSIPFTKIGGTIYYSYSGVVETLNKNKRNTA